MIAGIFKPQSTSIVQGDRNKRDLLAREVVEAQLSPYQGTQTARSSRNKVGTK